MTDAPSCLRWPSFLRASHNRHHLAYAWRIELKLKRARARPILLWFPANSVHVAALTLKASCNLFKDRPGTLSIRFRSREIGDMFSVRIHGYLIDVDLKRYIFTPWDQLIYTLNYTIPLKSLKKYLYCILPFAGVCREDYVGSGLKAASPEQWLRSVEARILIFISARRNTPTLPLIERWPDGPCQYLIKKKKQ